MLHTKPQHNTGEDALESRKPLLLFMLVLCHDVTMTVIYVAIICCLLGKTAHICALPGTAVSCVTPVITQGSKMHHFATKSLLKRKKKTSHFALVLFISGSLWQVFYRRERCCCGCPINDSMQHIRWKRDIERKMSLPGCSEGNFQYIIHRVCLTG